MAINKKSANRFMLAWNHIDETIKDKNAEFQLRSVVIER